MEQPNLCPYCGKPLYYTIDKRHTLPHVVTVECPVCKGKCMIIAITSKDESIKDARLNSRFPDYLQ